MNEDSVFKDPKLFRKEIRLRKWRKSTNGICPGYVQANLVILPKEYALDFTIFCLRNPQPCPILEILEPGKPKLVELSSDADIRTDIPQYRIFKNGKLTEYFHNLHIERSGNPAEVIEAICDNTAKDKIKFIGCLIIIYRLRNNLFHGVKWEYKFIWSSKPHLYYRGFYKQQLFLLLGSFSSKKYIF